MNNTLGITVAIVYDDNYEQKISRINSTFHHIYSLIRHHFSCSPSLSMPLFHSRCLSIDRTKCNYTNNRFMLLDFFSAVAFFSYQRRRLFFPSGRQIGFHIFQASGDVFGECIRIVCCVSKCNTHLKSNQIGNIFVVHAIINSTDVDERRKKERKRTRTQVSRYKIK